MACCRKEYTEECEILVCADATASHNLNLYNRLRFGLLASSWLPSPLGIFLWSALHVMLLIVGGPAFWVLELLTTFLFSSVCLFGGLCFVFSFSVWFSLFTVAIDLVPFLVQSIRFCWSLVAFLACHEPLVDWSRGPLLTVEFWKVCKDEVWPKVFSGCVAIVAIRVPCMSGNLYKETKNRKLKTWARWWEEGLDMHEVIVL